MRGFRTPEISRTQHVLWAHKLDDALECDHFARLLIELFDSDQFMAVIVPWRREYCLIEGQPPYDPLYLAALYIYGTLKGIRSSRQLEEACYNRIDVIWLMSGQTPDHSTIAAFMTKHRKRVKALFRMTVAAGIKARLIKLKHIAVDGTNIEADAGRGSVHRQATIREQHEDLDKTIDALEKQFQDNDQREAGLAGFELIEPQGSSPSEASPAGTGTVPTKRQLANLKAKRAELKKALEAIDRRTKETTGHSKDAKAIGSTTDGDSRVMKDKEGRHKPGYNIQLAVDSGLDDAVGAGAQPHADSTGGVIGQTACNSPIIDADSAAAAATVPPSPPSLPTAPMAPTAPAQRAIPRAVMIVALDISDSPNDLGQLMEMVALTQENCGKLPDAFSADAGYNTGRQLAELEDQKITAYIADKSDGIKTPEAKLAVEALREGKVLSLQQITELPRDPGTKKFTRTCFTYDAASNTYRCPAGEEMTHEKKGKRYDRDGPIDRLIYRTDKGVCQKCEYAKECCKNQEKGRQIDRDEFEDHRERMQRLLKTEKGKEQYKMRGQTVEPRIGHLKAGMGLRKFLRRGLEKVRSELTWQCAAMNIGVLLRNIDAVRAALTWTKHRNGIAMAGMG